MLTSDPVSSVCGKRESHQTIYPLIIPQCHVHCIHSATYLSWTVPLSFILSSDFYQTINFFSFFTITPLFRNSIPFTFHSFLITFLPTLLSLHLHSRTHQQTPWIPHTEVPAYLSLSEDFLIQWIKLLPWHSKGSFPIQFMTLYDSWPLRFLSPFPPPLFSPPTLLLFISCGTLSLLLFVDTSGQVYKP